MIPSAILSAHVADALDQFRTVDGTCDLSLLALTADYATNGRTDSLDLIRFKTFVSQYFRKFIMLNGNTPRRYAKGWISVDESIEGESSLR